MSLSQGRAREICEIEGGIATQHSDHILFVFDAPLPSLNSGDAAALHTTLLMEGILSALGDWLVENAGTRLFLAVSTSPAPFTDEPFNIESFGESEILTVPRGRAWREGFVSNMSVACDLLDTLLREQLGLEWEPVRDATSDGPIRYYVALLCNVEGPKSKCVGCEVPVRLRLKRRPDQWGVESTIEALRLNQGVCLGCNVKSFARRFPDHHICYACPSLPCIGTQPCWSVKQLPRTALVTASRSRATCSRTGAH